ncbi:MAG: selenite/tellurite reduction operon porin ExtI [Syntrophales bacterium]|nr:selenite/tellurite reduction operon porin ExtI [Syntrophales bacterium]
MANKRKTAKVLTCIIGLVLLAGTAYAGPQMIFGPNDEGVLQLDYTGQFQMTVRDTGSGPAKDENTNDFNFRRNRIALMGKYGDIMSIYVQTEFNEHQNIGPFTVSDDDSGSNFQMLDAVARFNFSDEFKVSVGKFKYNFSRENLEACEGPLTLDRSLFIRAPYVTTRDRGIAVWGNLFNDIFQYRADVMQGRDATTSAAPQPESNFRYSARAHVTLLDPEKDYGYKGTYMGQKKVLTIGGAYQFEPKVAYADTVAKTDAKDYEGWTADLFFEYPVPNIGTVTASAAYEKVDLDNAYQGANPDPDVIGQSGEKNGYYLKAGYLLPKLPLQFFIRYESWDFASLNGIVDQNIKWYGGGANYYFRNQNLKLTFEASRTGFDKGTGTSLDGTKDFLTFVTQLQVIF